MLFRRLRSPLPTITSKVAAVSSSSASSLFMNTMNNNCNMNTTSTSFCLALQQQSLLTESKLFSSSSNGSTSSNNNNDENQQQSFVTPTVYGDGDAFGTIVRKVHPKGFVSPLYDSLFWSKETRRSEEFKTARKLAVNRRRNVLLTGPANTGKRSVLVELMADIKKTQWEEYCNNNRQKNKNIKNSKKTTTVTTPAVTENTTDGQQKYDNDFERKFALISLKVNRAFSMPGALSALGFLGLRHIYPTTPVEQVASAIHRHIRLMKSAYGSCITTLKDVEVLAIDSLEDMQPNLFKALDNVWRELKNTPDVPFGGIQVVATANFWRMNDIDQSSPHGVYTFQTETFNELFPVSQTLLMHRFVHRQKLQNVEDGEERDTAEDLEKLNDFTINALFGNLPEDIQEFEEFFSAKKALPYSLPLDFSAATVTSSYDSPSAASATSAASSSNSLSKSLFNSLQTVQFADYASCVHEMFPAFARHPLKRIRAGDFINSSFKKLNTRFITWLTSLMVLPYAAGGALGLLTKLNLKVDDVVVFTRDLHDLDLVKNDSNTSNNDNKDLPPAECFSSDTITVEKGSLGTIVEVSEHRMKVQLWKGDRNVVTVLPMKITCFHSSYPRSSESVAQFPLLTLRRVYPDALVMLNIPVEAVVADARYFTEVNELGNVLAVLRRPSINFHHLREFLERPACIHEATKNYYEGLIEQKKDIGGLFGQMPHQPDLPTKLCRNCKTHVKAEEFREHWMQCIHECRWCTECSATVPLEKWEAHNEKHTVVMCLDCGRPLEWRNWALHRNTCGAMIREVSSNNEFLPSVTQQTALQMGVDGRDLHTVKQISKSNLPKSGKEVSKTHKTSFQYKATGFGF